MKILLLDIETSPNTAFVWGLFKQNIPISNVIDSSKVMCWSAKWYGTQDVEFDSIFGSTEKRMLKRIHKLISEADVVVHFNGSRFDMPILNKEFLIHGMQPPSPYKQVDLYKTVRSQFRFTSNKLDFVAQALGLGKKTKHAGFELWVKCMEKDPEAWEQMEEYNVQDVVLLERLYDRLLPWIKSHPNHNLYSVDGGVCTNCGSESYQSRGTYRTTAGVYQRFCCNNCGSWFRGIKSSATKNRYAYAS